LSDETFPSLCGNSGSNCILAHVRAATNPPTVESNNHPFIFGRHSFMHNGAITEFPRIRVAMLQEIRHKYLEMIDGNTDTEHFAALYFTYLGDINKTYSAFEMRNAIAKALWKVNEIQVKVLGYEVSNEMNLCTTDGENLCALRWRNNPFTASPIPLPGDTLPPIQFDPPSLYVSFDAASSLNCNVRKEYNSHMVEVTPEELTKHVKPASENISLFKTKTPHGPHVIVASEPATFNKDQWFSLYNGQFIMVDKEGTLHSDAVPVLDTVPVLNEEWGVRVSFDGLDTATEFQNYSQGSA